MPLSQTSIRKAAIATLCVFLALGMTGCAGSVPPDTALKSTQISDPLEPLNRGIFAFNNLLDRYLVEPVARTYNAVLPGFVRDGVQNFMRNLKTPIVLANNLLQGRIGDAGVTTARFFINTTAGIGGLVDVAEAQGLHYKQEDFGQTLAIWGLGDGFYVVLPVLGPSSLRDTAGLAVDTYTDPLRIWTKNTEREHIYYTRNIVEGLDNRARLVEAVRDLRQSSLDYYAAVRSAYSQKRASLIRNESGKTAEQDYPVYEDYDY